MTERGCSHTVAHRRILGDPRSDDDLSSPLFVPSSGFGTPTNHSHGQHSVQIIQQQARRPSQRCCKPVSIGVSHARLGEEKGQRPSVSGERSSVMFRP
jgi:hypothetical protein